jgi:hypothetical protein
MDPFSPRDQRTTRVAHRAAKPLTQAAGARPGVSRRVLPRHIRLQDACSIDLTYSEEELDQEYETSFRSDHFLADDRVTDASTTLNIPPQGTLSSADFCRSETAFHGLTNLRVVCRVGSQQAKIARQHHVAVWHGQVRSQAAFDEQCAPWSRHRH